MKDWILKEAKRRKSTLGLAGGSNLGRGLLLNNRGRGRGSSHHRGGSRGRGSGLDRLGSRGHRGGLGGTASQLSHQAVQLIEIHSLGTRSSNLLNLGGLQRRKKERRGRMKREREILIRNKIPKPMNMKERRKGTWGMLTGWGAGFSMALGTLSSWRRRSNQERKKE